MYRCDDNNYALKYIISQNKARAVAEKEQADGDGDAVMA
jgi:hypothetical protein